MEVFATALCITCGIGMGILLLYITLRHKHSYRLIGVKENEIIHDNSEYPLNYSHNPIISEKTTESVTEIARICKLCGHLDTLTLKGYYTKDEVYMSGIVDKANNA